MRKLLVMLLATICLNGCTSNEVKPFEEYQYDAELEQVEGEELYAVKCFKRKYRIWLDYIGALEKWQPAPATECKFLIGYQPKPYARLVAFLEYARKEAANCSDTERERSFSGTAEKSVRTSED